MRKLMWFTIGFTAACGLFVYVLPAEWILAGSIAALTGAALAGICGGDPSSLSRRMSSPPFMKKTEHCQTMLRYGSK